MKIYNSLSKKKEVFTSLKENEVTMYHCGPTVYDHVHIGNLRSFILGDFTRRSFEYLGYQVTQVMNITDIGHLVSDGDTGDDKMTKALKREGKEITLTNMIGLAGYYAELFKNDIDRINIRTPHHLPKASDHILEDIEIIKELENKGFTYNTSDGVYFNTKQMPEYGRLGGINLDPDESNARIAVNSEKQNQADFALWKLDNIHGWESPWGQGFPGWHIECSGMSMKYLGQTIDIHTGGADLRSIHHNNEIAQSECSTGKQFVNYWMHGEMLNFGGAKLSKSTGGNITLLTLDEKGYSPLAYRYLALQTHYRSPMNFTWEVLTSAQNGLQKIYHQIIELRKRTQSLGIISDVYQSAFIKKISDDINLPQALAVFHEMLKSDLSDADKLVTAYDFDQVFGLGLAKYQQENVSIPENIQILLNQRQQARSNKDWIKSDQLRDQIADLGFIITDKNEKQTIVKK